MTMRFDQAVHVGTPTPEFTKWLTKERTTKIICVHKFASLSTERCVDSPEFEGFDHQWCLTIYPGGDDDAVEEMTSIYLKNRSNKAIDIEFGFSVIDGSGKQVTYLPLRTPDHFDSAGGDEPSTWGSDVKRSKLLNSLVDGTLVIKVNMKSALLPFIPENPSSCKMIQGLFLSTKSADIAFKVGLEEQPKDNAMEAAKTAAVTFPAHRLIVENCSTMLADICESGGR
jgi:hypothetical protein